MNLSRAFAKDPKRENLIPIRDVNVGNWRDSNTGLGGGKYPCDVECESSSLAQIQVITGQVVAISR